LADITLSKFGGLRLTPNFFRRIYGGGQKFGGYGEWRRLRGLVTIMPLILNCVELKYLKSYLRYRMFKSYMVPHLLGTYSVYLVIIIILLCHVYRLRVIAPCQVDE